MECTYHILKLLLRDLGLDVDLGRIVKEDPLGQDASLIFGEETDFEEGNGVVGTVWEKR
jgi:hypothetical protein